MSENAIPAAERRAAREAAIRRLWRTEQPGGPHTPYLSCILDAARDERIHTRLREFAVREEIVSLYQGAAARELAGVAPYLVSLGTTNRLFDWIWDEGWGESWGIFLWSTLSFVGLRNHFRKFTKVTTPAGKTMLFRFYDPRVLPVFLPTCDAKQIVEFFGPVSRFAVESEGGRGLVEFAQNAGTLQQRATELAPLVSAP